MAVSRAGLKALLLDYSGLTLYKWATIPDGLYVFNYHRIGDSSATPFDSRIFSCSAEKFQQHLEFYKKDFDMLELSELAQVVEEKRKGRFGLITFDDGYLDNYELAFPLLRSENLSAIFFTPTDYIGSSLIPWWDEIAFMVRNSTKKHIVIEGDAVAISPSDIDESILMVLNKFKADTSSLPSKLAYYRDVLKPHNGLPKKNLFMNWQQLLEMQSAGMTIGSHSCSHNILSHLSDDDQQMELMNSRVILEEKMGAPIAALAYPVGNYGTYTQRTCELAQRCGYEYAFTFTNSINSLKTMSKFTISRIGISGEPNVSDLKRRIAFSRLA